MYRFFIKTEGNTDNCFYYEMALCACKANSTAPLSISVFSSSGSLMVKLGTLPVQECEKELGKKKKQQKKQHYKPQIPSSYEEWFNSILSDSMHNAVRYSAANMWRHSRCFASHLQQARVTVSLSGFSCKSDRKPPDVTGLWPVGWLSSLEMMRDWLGKRSPLLAVRFLIPETFYRHPVVLLTGQPSGNREQLIHSGYRLLALSWSTLLDGGKHS